MCLFFTLKMMHNSVLYDSAKNPMSRKNLVFQLWPSMLSVNQIAVFFDHQYVWKGSIDLLDFLHGDNHGGSI